VATVDSAVVIPPSTIGVVSKVDQITTSVPALTSVFTGAGVVHTVENGQSKWCIDFGDGNSTCSYDAIPQPATSGVAWGLLLQGSTMYQLTLISGVYSVDSKYTKKTQ
jgi:hypothetical protein